MKTPKKIPLRVCLGCGEMFPKKSLIRVVKSPTGEVSLDITGKKQGRGAYICKDIECFNKARKARKFEKTFSQKISDEVYSEMESELLSDEQ